MYQILPIFNIRLNNTYYIEQLGCKYHAYQVFMFTFIFSFSYLMFFGRARLSITAYQIQLAGEFSEFAGQSMTIDITLWCVMGWMDGWECIALSYVAIMRANQDQTYRTTSGGVVQVCIFIG